MRRLAMLVLTMACSGSASDLPPGPTAPPPSVAVATVTVSAPAPTMAVGASQQMVATLKDVTGSVLVGRAISWSTSAPAVMTVTTTGAVTAVSPGTVTITASSEQRTGIAVLTVSTGDPFTSLGAILTSADFGVTAGLPVADVTAIQLADGRVRLYLFAQEQGIRSAISTSATGVTFAAEPGVRSTTAFWGQPRVVRLPDGRTRLYYFAGDGIRSGTSVDGLTFVDDPGLRIAKATIGYEIGALSIVATTGGGYRAYFSDLERPGALPGGHYVRSAVSTDLLNWTVETGIVLGVGATSGINETATHPFAEANADGSVTLYYQGERADSGVPGGRYRGIYRATAVDGRTFTREEKTGIKNGGDPDVITLANGTTMMYYGDHDTTRGGFILAAILNR